MNETNWEHYKREIATLQKTDDCSDCPIFEKCAVKSGEQCRAYFIKWAMQEYKPDIQKHTMQEVSNFLHMPVAKDKPCDRAKARVLAYESIPYKKQDVWDTLDNCIDVTAIVSDAITHDWNDLVLPQD